MGRFRRLFQALVAMLAIGIGLFFLVAVPLWQGSRDRRLIQGEWTAEGVAVTVSNDQMVIQRSSPDGTKQVSNLQFKLKRQGAAVPRIVLLDKSDSTPLGLRRGLYDLVENSLRLCLGKPGGEAPSEFGQDGTQILELKRLPLDH